MGLFCFCSPDAFALQGFGPPIRIDRQQHERWMDELGASDAARESAQFVWARHDYNQKHLDEMIAEVRSWRPAQPWGHPIRNYRNISFEIHGKWAPVARFNWSVFQRLSAKLYFDELAQCQGLSTHAVRVMERRFTRDILLSRGKYHGDEIDLGGVLESCAQSIGSPWPPEVDSALDLAMQQYEQALLPLLHARDIAKIRWLHFADREAYELIEVDPDEYRTRRRTYDGTFHRVRDLNRSTAASWKRILPPNLAAKFEDRLSRVFVPFDPSPQWSATVPAPVAERRATLAERCNELYELSFNDLENHELQEEYARLSWEIRAIDREYAPNDDEPSAPVEMGAEEIARFGQTLMSAAEFNSFADTIESAEVQSGIRQAFDDYHQLVEQRRRIIEQSDVADPGDRTAQQMAARRSLDARFVQAVEGSLSDADGDRWTAFVIRSRRERMLPFVSWVQPGIGSRLNYDLAVLLDSPSGQQAMNEPAVRDVLESYWLQVDEVLRDIEYSFHALNFEQRQRLAVGDREGKDRFGRQINRMGRRFLDIQVAFQTALFNALDDEPRADAIRVRDAHEQPWSVPRTPCDYLLERLAEENVLTGEIAIVADAYRTERDVVVADLLRLAHQHSRILEFEDAVPIGRRILRQVPRRYEIEVETIAKIGALLPDRDSLPLDIRFLLSFPEPRFDLLERLYDDLQ